MFRSHKIFTAFGIPVKVHGTLLLFLVLAGFLFGSGGGLPGILLTVLFLALIFSFVLLHELGHSLVAKLYRIPVREITLYPLGGIAGLEHMPRDPKIELHVAIAGPAVNFLLAGLFAILFTVLGGVFWAQLVIVNLFLGGFNLLPGFPLDGGRILRAYLARRRPYLEATRIATTVGQNVALGLGALGVLGLFGVPFLSPMLIPIAIFVYFAARAELNRLLLEEQMAQPAVSDWFLPRFHVKRPTRDEDTRRGPEVFEWPFEPSRRRDDARARPRVLEVLPDGSVRPVE